MLDWVSPLAFTPIYVRDGFSLAFAMSAWSFSGEQKNSTYAF
jgi:hypothetical protein